MSMWNIHICKKRSQMFIHNIHIGIQKHSKLVHVRNFYLPYWVLRFFDMRRERHNFFLCWLFHLTPTTCAPCANYWSGLGELRSWLACLEFKSQLTAFVQISKSSAPLPGMTSFTSPVHFLSGDFIVTSVIVISSPCVHGHLHLMCAPN